MKKAIIIIFLLIAGFGFGQTTGSYWRVSKLTTPVGKELLDSTQVYVKSNQTWYQLNRNVSATMTMQKAIDSSYCVVSNAGSVAAGLLLKVNKADSGINKGYAANFTVNAALATKSATTHDHSGVYAPISHTQAISTITGLQDSLTNHNTKAQTLTAFENAYAQGLRWDQSADTYTRLGSIAAATKGVSPGNSALPIQSLMKGCLLTDNGVVNYYLNATDWTLKANGDASILTGADGQVMVQIPKFYVKYVNVGNTIEWWISLYQLPGYSVHNAFIKDNVEVPHRYIGAYEAVLWDATTDSAYRDYKAGVTINTGTDKLSSVSGFRPVTSITRAGARAMAARRGTGWRQQDYDLTNAIEMLFIVEYATFNSQSIMSGITNVADWPAYNNYYPIVATGLGNSIGNATGQNAAAASTACATVAATGYSKYRGISNFYGHIFKFVDGFNINANVPYVSNNSAVWADDTSVGYDYLGVTMTSSDGWQSTLVNSSRAMLPATVGAASTTKITDYYYQSTGWRVAVFGGGASNGAAAGAVTWDLRGVSGYSSQDSGARLSF